MRAEEFAGIRSRIAVGMVGYGVGLSFALVWPTVSLVCYGAMPLLYLVPSRIDKHVKVAP